jgi:hypothetical protein
MVGGVVGVRGGALVGFGVGMMVGSYGAGGCACWLRDCFICCCMGAMFMGGKGMARPEQRICGVIVECRN